jgi:type IV pilus assembly protein PilO
MIDFSHPETRKKLLLGAALVCGLAYAGHEYLYRPRAEELGRLERRLEALHLRNVTARAISEGQGQAEVEQRLARFRDQLERVERLVPSSEELPDLLDAISAEAQRTGVELTRIQPMGAAAEDYYTRRSYELAVQGSYHQVGEFLTRIASLPRIVTPTSLLLKTSAAPSETREPVLEAKFMIETYVLPSAPVPHVE